jgi:hypothetical protein
MTRDLAYDAMAKSLLIKRLAFKHEREVRALLFTPARGSFEAGADLLQCPVNPHELIDQIMLDPRYSAEDADCVRRRIVEETNFGREILRSLLYAPPPRLVIDFAPPKVKRPPKLDIPTGWVQMVPTRKPSKKARKTPVFDVSEDV